MAYSKTPEGDTHSVTRIPAAGSPFIVPSNYDANIPQSLNYYNCFPHVEKQFGAEPRFSIQKREAYISNLSATTSGNSSAAFAQWVISSTNDDTIFFARNNTYYEAEYTGSGSVTITSVGTMASAYETAVTQGINSSNERRIIAINGNTVNTWLEDGSGFTTTTGGTVAVSLVPTGGIVYLNGYLFMIGPNRRIYNSTAGGVFTTWASTDFIDAETYPDITLFLGKHHNYLVGFGESSTEFFYDGANEVGSPLSRQETYAARIGCHVVENQYKALAYINDDIYFIGKSPDDTLFLAVVQDFKVKPIDSPLLDEILNSPTDTRIWSIETWTVNNVPQILIKISKDSPGMDTGIVYNPSTDSWWTIDLSDIAGNVITDTIGDILIGNQFFNKSWNSATARYPFFMTCASSMTSETITFKYPDKDWATSNTAYIWTQVEDMGNNRYKHVYRVSAIGDYEDNVLTLSFCNNPTYNSWTTCTPTITQSTIGADNDVTWTNLGQFRQFSLRLQITGSSPMDHRGFEVSYNLKMI